MPEESLKTFLQMYMNGDTTVRYFAAFVHLTNRDRREAVVYFTGPHCGTGGCGLLVLEPEGSSYKVITSTTIGWPPIYALNTSTNGWRDLAIRVVGGGIHPGYEAFLRFNGKTYPRNPSMPPAKPLRGKVTGQILVPEGVKGTPLY